MRIDDAQVEAIKAGVASCFGADAIVRLYGSRLDDRRRGGDVDLFVEVADAVPDYKVQAAFLDRLEPIFDGRKIDVHFMILGAEPSGFDRIACRDGRVL